MSRGTASPPVDPLAHSPTRVDAEEHAFPGTVAETLALVVAPSTGRFRPQRTDGYALAGELLGHITGGRGRCDDVIMPTNGNVRALLARPGQLVQAGRNLAWVDRSDEQPA